MTASLNRSVTALRFFNGYEISRLADFDYFVFH